MKQSETIIKIAPALLKAQRSLRVAIKDASNPAFKSKFADLTSIIEVAQPALNDAEITFLQPITWNEGRVVIETILLHSSGEWISDCLEIPLTNKQDAQAVGSCITYGRRYGLQAFIGIRAEDDDGNKASEELEKARGRNNVVLMEKPNPAYITSAQAKQFRDLAMKKGFTPAAIKTVLLMSKIESSAQIPAGEFDDWMRYIEDAEIEK